jgi:hypothetical protein
VLNAGAHTDRDNQQLVAAFLDRERERCGTIFGAGIRQPHDPDSLFRSKSDFHRAAGLPNERTIFPTSQDARHFEPPVRNRF